jgi:hypothetical protein
MVLMYYRSYATPIFVGGKLSEEEVENLIIGATEQPMECAKNLNIPERKNAFERRAKSLQYGFFQIAR